MKIVHFADTHIGPFPGPVVNGKNARAEDTLRCFDELIGKVEQIMPDLTIIAGDLFHASKTWSERGLGEVNDAIARINRLANIAPVAIVRGTPNHDGEQHYQILNTHFVAEPTVEIITNPGCYLIETKDGFVNLCALPGFDRGYWRSQNPGVDRVAENEVFSESIEKMLLGMRAMCDNSYPSVLVGHYTVEGANTESGQTMMFSQFEPVITHRALTTAKYDLCCFGHIHRPQELGANAFYSGAINRLNFNDEGQERGFYVHTLVGGALRSSEFVELHPRKFKTVRLDDSDISNFNLAGVLPHYNVKDAIVRVIYDCTDENQKALNRAQMEKVFMDMGAFWVQEITPRNITVTVNRTELASENNPLSNLSNYLATSADNLDENTVADVMTLGREIIDAVLANGHADKSSGLFVPVEISVTNYRNYRSETFSFDDVRFATINGMNGVGKSSLFMDAIYDALYEDPREGDLTGWICNDPDVRSGSIVFTFRVGERVWRVSRTRVKSGKATLNLSEMVDGTWVDRSSEKMRDTQGTIERVIGIDGQTLRACALIMQDQYGLFLQAGKEERMQILSDILGLGIYDEMADAAADRAADINRELRALHAKQDELLLSSGELDLLKEQLADAVRSIDGYSAQLDTLNRELESYNEELTKLNASSEVYALYHHQIVELNDAIVQLKKQKEAAEADAAKYAAILADQSEIIAGAEKYRAAVAVRDSLQDKIGAYTALLEKRARIENAMWNAEDNRKQNAKRAEEIAERMDVLRTTVGRRDDYERQKREHDQLLVAIEAAEDGNVKWRDAESEVNNARQRLNDTRNAERGNFRERVAEIEGVKKRVAMLENSGCPIAATSTCRFLADAVAAREQLPALEETHAKATETARIEIERLDAIVKAAEAARDAIQHVDDATIAQMRARARELVGASVMLTQIESYAAELASLEAKRKETDERDSAIANELETYKSQIAGVDTDIAEYSDAHDAYRAAVNDITAYRACADKEQQLIGAKDRYDAAQDRVADCKRSIDANIAHIKEREEKLAGESAIDDAKISVYNSIVATKAHIDDVQAKRDRNVGVKATLEADIARYKDMIAKANVLGAEINDKARTATLYEILKGAFGSNGIPHNITRSIVPVFEATASNILGQMSHGAMSIELITEKVLKSNSKKEVTTLDVIVNDAVTGRLPYLSRSGGERVKAALSVILALSEVMKNKLGVQLGFLMIDEAPFLDGTGVQAYCDALETIQRRYPDMKIMAITHDESFKARFPQSVTVTKDAAGSHAIME